MLMVDFPAAGAATSAVPLRGVAFSAADASGAGALLSVSVVTFGGRPAQIANTTPSRATPSTGVSSSSSARAASARPLAESPLPMAVAAATTWSRSDAQRSGSTCGARVARATVASALI